MGDRLKLNLSFYRGFPCSFAPRKYVKDFPAKMMKPPGKPCLVSVSVIGLRNLDLLEGAAFQESDPVLLGLGKKNEFAKVGF